MMKLKEINETFEDNINYQNETNHQNYYLLNHCQFYYFLQA